MEKIRVLTAGDSALLIQFEQRIGEDVNRRISATVKLLKMQQIEGIVDMIPAYASLLVQYNPLVIRYEEIYKRVSAIVKMDTKVESMEKKVWEIPVLYGGELGPDFSYVVEHAGISGEELIRLHSEKDYLVYMLGFLPGFTYLGGLEEKLHTPETGKPQSEDSRRFCRNRRFSDRCLSCGLSGRLAVNRKNAGEDVRPGKAGSYLGTGRRIYPFLSDYRR